MSERALLESVADAVAAGEAVDWRDVEQAAADTGDADLISQLRIVSAIGAGRRAPLPDGPSRWDRTLEACVAIVLTIAIAQFALAMVGISAALARSAWLHVVNVLVFGLGGIVLLAGGGRDRRLPLLGGLFLTISSAFVPMLMPSTGAGLGGTPLAVLRPFLPDAFLALMLWRFVREFPVDTQRPTARRVASVFMATSFAVGAVLFAVNAIARLGDWTMPVSSIALLELLELFDRDSAEGFTGQRSSPLLPPLFRFSCGRRGSRRTRTDVA